MTPITRTEVFKDNTLDKIKNILERMDEMGNGKFFSVQVDGETVVSLTNNPNELDRVKNFLFHNTDFIRITYYKNQGGEVMETVTYEMPKQQPVSLSGVDVDEKIKSAIDAERRKWEFAQLQKELSQTKQDLREAEEYISQMENLVEDLKKSKGKIGNVHVGEVISVMVESFMRRNVDKIKKLPGGSALAGLLTETPQEQPQTVNESNASFEQINEQEPSWWQDVEDAFTPDEVELIKAIIAHLVQQKEKIKTVLELLIQK